MAINEGALLLIAVYCLKVYREFIVSFLQSFTFAFTLIITSLTLLSKALTYIY